MLDLWVAFADSIVWRDKQTKGRSGEEGKWREKKRARMERRKHMVGNEVKVKWLWIANHWKENSVESRSTWEKAAHR